VQQLISCGYLLKSKPLAATHQQEGILKNLGRKDVSFADQKQVARFGVKTWRNGSVSNVNKLDLKRTAVMKWKYRLVNRGERCSVQKSLQ